MHVLGCRLLRFRHRGRVRTKGERLTEGTEGGEEEEEEEEGLFKADAVNEEDPGGGGAYSLDTVLTEGSVTEGERLTYRQTQQE